MLVNTIKAFLLPLSFIASWILPIAPKKMSGVPGTNPQVHDFDKIYDYKTLEDFGYVFHNGIYIYMTSFFKVENKDTKSAI